MRNLYVIGPQCTGKTTLVNALEEAYAIDTKLESENVTPQPAIVREVARTVLKEKGFSREDITTSPARAFELQKYILEAQFEAETTATTINSPSWYICDRSGLDPVVYTLLFVGANAAAEMLASKAWMELENRMKEGVVILCEAGCHWLTDDGTRLMPTSAEDWVRVDDAFRELLQARDIAFSLLSKDTVELSKRVEFVRERMNARHAGLL